MIFMKLSGIMGYFIFPLLFSSGGNWVHENRNIRLKNGDTVYYWLYMLVNGGGRQVTGQKYVEQSINA